jgi:hypothetical protein
VATAISAASSVDLALAIVAARPPAEVMIQNRETLKTMRVDPDITGRFLAQQQYSPRAKTILIAALAGMNGTTGREMVLNAALDAPDEETAIFYQQLAELLCGYDARVARILHLRQANRLVLAQDINGKMILLAPIDYLIWDQLAATRANEFAKTMHLARGGRRFEVWITGTASARFKRESAALGITVMEGVGRQLPLAD